jgi:hypothetical protein
MKIKNLTIFVTALFFAIINAQSAPLPIDQYPVLIVGKWQPEHGPAWIYNQDGTYSREGISEHGVYKFSGNKLILDNEAGGGTIEFKNKDFFTFKGHSEKKWPFVRIQ